MSPPDAALTANSLSWPSTAVLWLTLSGISREIERLSSLTCYRATFCSAGGLSDGRNFVHCAKISSTFSHVVACRIQQLSENVGFICCLNLLTKSFLDSSKFLFCSWSSLNWYGHCKSGSRNINMIIPSDQISAFFKSWSDSAFWFNHEDMLSRAMKTIVPLSTLLVIVWHKVFVCCTDDLLSLKSTSLHTIPTLSHSSSLTLS